MGVALARMGEKRNVFFVGKPEGKRPLGKRRCRWENNIKMNIREIRSADMDWVDLVQGRNQ
jgi:hypothetical protein